MAGETAVTRFQAWQAARLQAQAAMTRALCHDLRGMLAPGSLVAERLQASADPAQRVAGDRVAAMVARATERLRADHDAALELAGPALESVALELLPMPVPGGLELARDVPTGMMVRVNVSGFAAAFGELAANRAAAGARVMRVSAGIADGRIGVLVRDDGLGLPGSSTFKPPSGPDGPIGLALARDLLRGMGGDLRRVEGAEMVFEISLRPD